VAWHIQRSAQDKNPTQHIQPRETEEGPATTVMGTKVNAEKHPSQDLPHAPTMLPAGTRDPCTSSSSRASANSDTGVKPEMFERIGTAINEFAAGQAQTNQLLTKVTQVLETANRILISTQNCQCCDISLLRVWRY
ncbi:hypothetical protein FRC08_008407, partial [Ceratobasidium sp. 394]